MVDEHSQQTFFKHIIQGGKSPQKLSIKGKLFFEGNNAEGDLACIGNNHIVMTGSDWHEVTDVINTETGHIWRVEPSDPEKRVIKCFADQEAYYIVEAKGFEAMSRNLIKRDKKTLEALWSCGLSMVSGRTYFQQDDEFIYYTDQRNVFSFSKSKGKKVGKFKYIDTENALKKKLIAPDSSYLFEYYNRGIVISGYEKKSYNYIIRYVDFLSEDSVWSLNLGKLEFVAASVIIDDRLYLLTGAGNIVVVSMASGEILCTAEADKTLLPFGLRNASRFTHENGCLYVIAKGEIKEKYQGLYKTVLVYDIKANTCQTFDATEILGIEMNIFHETEIIKNGIIYSTGKKHIKAVEIDSMKELSNLLLEDQGSFIERFMIAGGIIYLVQKIKGHDKNDLPLDNSLLYQIG